MNAPLPASSQFADVSPGTLQQFTTLLLERLAASELPELGGMIRLHGRWTDPGRASGKSYYGAKIVDDGGSQAKVEILASLVASRGVLPGHLVIATGRLAVRSTNYGLEVRLVATDIELGDQEQAAKTEVAQQGRMTIERLRSIPMRRVPFPDRDSVSVTLIHSNSAAAQVTQDCMAELSKLGDSVGVFPVKVNMLDPVAIATAIRDANSDDIVMIIRGGGDAADFEVFDDPRVVTALSSQQAHRVVGLGHTGNATLLDLFCDFSANTPAQARTSGSESSRDSVCSVTPARTSDWPRNAWRHWRRSGTRLRPNFRQQASCWPRPKGACLPGRLLSPLRSARSSLI